MKRKTIISSLFILTLLSGSCAIISKNNFFQKNLIVVNNTVYSNLLPSNSFKSTYNPKLNFEDMPVSSVSGITFNILDQKNITNIPVLLKMQRYYIPLSYISQKLNYRIDNSNNNDTSITLDNGKETITLSSDSYKKDSDNISLRGNLLSQNDDTYISISDIEQIFNLVAVFDFNTKTINLLPSNSPQPEDSSVLFNNKIALLRFEDFTAGDTNSVDKNQTKVKCMADLLYSNGIKFHIAWIPRFKSPNDNIDNDLLTNDTIENVGFVNLLDYLINKGAKIGLHGYTHQSGNERSAVGEELSENVNNTEEETKAVIENGLDTASALNIPISFFESPHYKDTPEQQKIIEKYFQFIYEPFNNSTINIYKNKNNNLYIPTPLGYLNKPDDTSIVDALNSDYNPEKLHSFFYHPSIEVEFINFNTENNKLNVSYDPNSPLQKIVKALKDNEYSTVHVDELIDK